MAKDRLSHILIACFGLALIVYAGVGLFKNRPSVEKSETIGSFLAQEMVSVVFKTNDPRFSSVEEVLGPMLQGASLDGLYRGLIHSSEYRTLEESFRSASPRALILFSEELAWFQVDLKRPKGFFEWDREPFQRISLASIQQPDAHETIDFNRPKGWVKLSDESFLPRSVLKKDVDAAERDFEDFFRGASFYTLKRILGEVALHWVQEKDDLNNLYEEFARYAVRTQGKGTFGFPFRDKADESAHKNWARRQDPGRLSWEILNRIHRMMNAIQ